MNDHPRLRRALGSLAARETVADPGAVVARASAIRRRRMALTGGTAVSVAAVLGVAVALASATPPARSVLAPLTESPSAEVTSAPGEPTTTPLPGRPPVQASDTPSPEPTTEEPLPTSPQPSWTYPPPGMRLTLTVTPDQAWTSFTEVVVTVRVTDTDGWWNGGELDFGDGNRRHFAETVADCAPPPTGPPPPHTAAPSDQTRTFRHTYTKAGSYRVSVRVRTVVGLCGPTGVDEEDTASHPVTVTDDPDATNGPSVPAVSFYFTEAMGSETSVKISGSDEDGHFVRYIVTWGDGSPDTVVDLDYPCVQEPGARYPSRDTLSEQTRHKYAKYAQYDVTVRAVTAGCDGRYEQTGVSKTQQSM